MTEEHKLLKQQEKGTRGKLVLEELETAFSALENDCFESFRNSDIHDDDGRKMCRLYLKVMKDVKDRFDLAVRTGDAAGKELAKMHEKKKYFGK